MKIAAYQFAVSSNIQKNMESIEKAINEAKGRKTELLVFPECALTGYPPRDIPSSSRVDFAMIEECCLRLKRICDETGVAIILGMIARDDEGIYNRAAFFAPGEECKMYDKRALWGWDKDNFTPGKKLGVIDYKSFRIGIRICYEVRFPEYFRELYKAQTDMDAVLFYDVTDTDDMDRYNMIRGHLQTRAVENVCTIISANTICPYQTAPTAIIGRSGHIIAECHRNVEGFVEFDLKKQELDFGEKGRKELSDSLIIF